MRLLAIVSAVMLAMNPAVAEDSQELHAAAKTGNTARVLELLGKGAKINAQDKAFNTPLIHAVDNGHTETALLLISKGADVKAVSSSGLTALSYAAGTGDLKVMQALLAKGADPWNKPLFKNKSNGEFIEGEVPFKIAMLYGNKQGVLLMLEGVKNLDDYLQDGSTLLMHAVMADRIEMVALLLKRGLKVDAADRQGNTPLIAAAYYGRPKIAALLITKGANVNTVAAGNEFARRPLTHAAKRGFESVARVLIARGADIHADDDQALKEAEKEGYEEIVALLKAPPKVKPDKDRKPIVEEEQKKSQADFSPATPVNIAMIPFTNQDASYVSAGKSADFSTLLQISLENLNNITLIDRADIQKAEKELGASAFGLNDEKRTLRLGKLLKAHLFVIGKFSRDDGDGSFLDIEVVDTRRADVLARRRLLIQCDPEQRFSFSTEDVERASIAVKSALSDSARILASPRRTVAPLFFRNISKAGKRLNFLEVDMLAEFGKVKSTDLRILRFPKPGEGAEEGSLVLSGLVESDPNAWRNVADVYVWGTFEEVDSEGVPFADVKIRVNLEVWNGSDKLNGIAETIIAKDIPSVIPNLVEKVLVIARETKGAPEENVRKVIAEALYKRANEFQPDNYDRIDEYLLSGEWKRSWKCRKDLLEIAHFFAPDSSEILCELLLDRWCEEEVFNTSRKSQLAGRTSGAFWKRWRQSNEWEEYLQRFGTTYIAGRKDSYKDSKKRPSSGNSLEFYRRNGYTLDLPNIYIHLPVHAAEYLPRDVGSSFEEVPWSLVKQWRAVFAAELVHRLEVVASSCPQCYDYQGVAAIGRGGSDFPMFRMIEEIKDPKLQASAFAALWKLSGEERVSAAEIEQFKRRLLGSFTYLKREAEAQELFAKYAGPKLLDEPPKEDKENNKQLEYLRNHSEENEKERRQALLAVKGTLPGEIKATFVNAPCIPEKTPVLMNVFSVVSYGGQIWLAGIDRNNGDHSGVWSYNPVSKKYAEVPETRIPMNQGNTYQLCNTVAVQNDVLWITHRNLGVWRFDPKARLHQKFTAKEGLPTEQVLAAAVGDGKYYCGGGLLDGQIGVFDSVSNTWGTISREGGLKGITKLTYAKNHLLVREGDSTHSFYDVQKRTWTPLPDLPDSATRIRSVSVGTAEGFWFGSGTKLLLINPESKQQREFFTSVPLVGNITSLANDGDYLWVATLQVTEKHDKGMEYCDTRIYLLQKSSGKLVGFMRVPKNEPVNHLLATASQLWLGLGDGNGLGDVDHFLISVDKKSLRPPPPAEWQVTAK